MRIDIITIFPGYFAPLHQSLIGRAIADGIIDLAVHDLRDWTQDNHHTVDDSPYGGGPGMVMRPDIWGAAIDAVVGAPPGAGRGRLPEPDPRPGGRTDPHDDATTGPRPARDDDLGDIPDAATDSGPTGGLDGPVLVIPTPSGERLTQAVVAELATARHLVVACGRYEGIDGRVAMDAARRMTVREISIGDYVLAGGEAAALVLIEAVGRLLPGVLGNVDSAGDDSFSAGTSGLLESPAYTRPADFRGLGVPEVLLSGHHAAIARYRRDESLRRTARYRPDLLARLTADDCDGRDLEVLSQIGATPPAGLAERVAAERAARAARKRRRRHTAPGA